MTLNLRSFGLIFALLGASVLEASSNESSDKDFYKIVRVEVKEVTKNRLGHELFRDLRDRSDSRRVENPENPVDPAENVGKVIQVAKDLVALGEDVYKLVIKGKPANATNYSPISVIPRVNGEAVDLLETENWEAPVKRTYEVKYHNTYGVAVVTFRYSIIYSYNGSYNGKGAYLTSVQIVPEFVRTLFGFNFTATMKLGGIQNQGTRENPVAGATILIEYTVSSVMVANNSVDSFFITGRGGFKRL